MALAVEHKESWSNTVLSKIGLGLSDLLLKFHFLFCNPQLLISLGSIWCVFENSLLMWCYVTAGHFTTVFCSYISFPWFDAGCIAAFADP